MNSPPGALELEVPVQAVPGGLRLGPYEVLHAVAPSGDHGVVLAASEARASGRVRRVALTVVDPRELSEPQRRALLERWTNATSLGHPTLVPALDSGVLGDGLFVATPWLEGWDLDAILSRSADIDAPLSTRQVAALGLDLAEALAFVHELRDDAGEPLGLVHGRVCVPRVMLMRSGHIKLLGFPIPRGSRTLVPAPEDLSGFAFVAPEQLDGAEPDARTDIYALSVLLATALLGSNPLQRETREATARAIRAGLRLPDSFDPDVRAILERGLSVDPDQRPQTARWIAIRLGQVLSATGGPLQPSEWRAVLHDMFPDGLDWQGNARRDQAQAMLSNFVPRLQGTGEHGAGLHTETNPTRPGTSAATVIAVIALMGVAFIVSVMVGWMVREPEPVKRAPHVEQAAAPAPDGVAPLLDEARALMEQRRHAAVLDTVHRAQLVGTPSPGHTAALAQLRDAATRELDLAAVERLVELGSNDAARSRAHAMLELNPEDTEVAALLARIDGAIPTRRPGPPSAGPAATAPSPRPVATRVGFLAIESTPRAVAYVDGAPVGTTPVKRLELTPGPHDVVLRLGGHHEVRRRVVVEAGGTKTLATELTASSQGARGSVTVRSTPSAVVFVDGSPIGTTPLPNHVLPPGRHEIELRSGGHQPVRRTIELGADGHEEVEVTLRPVAEAGGGP